MATYRNNRSNETVNSDLTHEEALKRFRAGVGNDPNHWLYFWLHKYAQQYTPAQPDETNGNAGKTAAFIGDLFVYAVGLGLKKPMIRLHYRGQRFKLYLSAKGTLCLKTGDLVPDPVFKDKWTNDPVGDERYIGYIAPQGGFRVARVNPSYDNDYRSTGYRTGRYYRRPVYNNPAPGQPDNRPLYKLTEVEREFLARLSSDPIGFMAECSKDVGRCCYCPQPLEDARSKKMGYGPICAKRWGLPWGDDRRPEECPSFAKCYNNNPAVATMCHAIKTDPTDEVAWAILADALEEAGLPRCKKPESKVVVPRL
jgi:hypothetical protein